MLMEPSKNGHCLTLSSISTTQTPVDCAMKPMRYGNVFEVEHCKVYMPATRTVWLLPESGMNYDDNWALCTLVIKVK